MIATAHFTLQSGESAERGRAARGDAVAPGEVAAERGI
jgi:hypothetical protein